MDPKKKIAINLLQFSHKSATGGFVYIKNLLDNLLPLDHSNLYFLLLPLGSYIFFKKKYGKYKNVRFKIIDFRSDLIFNPVRAILKLWAKVKKDYFRVESILKEEVQNILIKNAIQLHFSPSGAIYPKSLAGVKIVATVYDLQHEYFPENFSKDYLKRRIEDCKTVVAQSDKIIAISEFTKRTLIEIHTASPDKIKVIYLAPQRIEINPDVHMDVPKEYLFYPAAIWPHKNHRMLIEALALLHDRFPELCIVFTGVIKKQSLLNELKNLALEKKIDSQIIFRGYVGEQELGVLYIGARALVYPSAFEGFKMPLLEAFSYGVPVIAADNSCIAEVVGDAGILYKTEDLKALVVAIETVLTDQNLRATLIAKGHEQVQKFSWQKAAQETIAVFNSL